MPDHGPKQPVHTQATSDQQAKLRFLATASAELASSLDYQATLRCVAQMAVPWFADWCAISLAQDGRLHTLAVAHVDPTKMALVEDMERRYPADPDASQGSYTVLRSGRSELILDTSDEMLVAAAKDDQHLRLLRELNFRSALVVPLTARERVLGVITWVTGDEGRLFTPADVQFGEDLARRAAVAIDNAQLHTELREVAVQLQRAVLPERLPAPPGWQTAVCYLPAGRTDAGGDFYDVVPLPDDRLVAFVGDVMGRGVQAASAMAQIRAAVRTLVALDPDPVAVLSRLQRLFACFDLQQLVTLVYMVLDPAKQQLQVVNAGHPRPLLLRASGELRELATGDTLLLGVGEGGDDSMTSAANCRAMTTFDFGDGDIVLMFTDGLVERRGEDIDAGTARLSAAARAVVERAADGAVLCDSLVELVQQVRDPDRDDDVAVLAIRRSTG
jgi:serine phosphatase RsbU (regulator of sigma subunit)